MKVRYQRWILIAFAVVLISIAVTISYKLLSETNQDGESDISKTELAIPVNTNQDEADLIADEPPMVGGVSTEASVARLARFSEKLDPQKSGWPSEAFSDDATNQLSRIAKFLAQPQKIDSGELIEIASSNFECAPLRPNDLRQVFDDQSFVVSRQLQPSSIDAIPRQKHQGISGFTTALKSLADPLDGADQVRAKFKVVEVTLVNNKVTTKANFEASGITATGSIQQNATWLCTWRLRNDQPPHLETIQVLDYEEVSLQAEHRTIFTDCTEAVLAHNDSFHKQLLFGLPHWVKRIELRQALNTFARYGGSVGDANGDGLDDLYVCQPGGLPNLLFMQNKDGTATDLSKSAGVDILDCSTSAIFVDLDNDGDQDLIVTIWYELLVFENDSHGRFELRSRLPAKHRDVQSLSAADYDNDGRVDLYITVDMTVGETRSDEAGGRFLYHDANDGAANHLYRNEISHENWSFSDVTKKVGLDVNNRRHSLAAAWEDFDNDGDMDLYVANDFGQNCLYRNDNGHFVDVAPMAGVVDHGSGMSVSWGDYDRDGLMDLYIGNMFSSAGNRITNQKNFKADSSDLTRNMYRRMAKGNTLFHNEGGGTFREHIEADVEMGRWAWSSLFADINNDGWDDLLVANGYLTTNDSGDL